jgi:hypothetical protein
VIQEILWSEDCNEAENTTLLVREQIMHGQEEEEKEV